jgi:hypothetical protein
MRTSIGFPSVATCLLLTSLSVAAQETKDAAAQQSPAWYNPKKYNPAKLVKRDPKSANDQLASNGDLEAKLTHQLQAQGVLAQDKNLQEACSDFKELADCVATLRASQSLQIDFSCLKWDVTGVKPKPVADSCAGPAGGKAMGLYRAIELLKSDADAKSASKEALRRAREDIKDASE